MKWVAAPISSRRSVSSTSGYKGFTSSTLMMIFSIVRVIQTERPTREGTMKPKRRRRYHFDGPLSSAVSLGLITGIFAAMMFRLAGHGYEHTSVAFLITFVIVGLLWAGLGQFENDRASHALQMLSLGVAVVGILLSSLLPRSDRAEAVPAAEPHDTLLTVVVDSHNLGDPREEVDTTAVGPPPPEAPPSGGSAWAPIDESIAGVADDDPPVDDLDVPSTGVPRVLSDWLRVSGTRFLYRHQNYLEVPCSSSFRPVGNWRNYGWSYERSRPVECLDNGWLAFDLGWLVANGTLRPGIT
jgi:hypothetical protein